MKVPPNNLPVDLKDKFKPWDGISGGRVKWMLRRAASAAGNTPTPRAKPPLETQFSRGITTL